MTIDNAIVDAGSDPVGNAIVIPLDSYFEAMSSGVYTQEDKNVIAEELFSLVVANDGNSKVIYTFRGNIATVIYFYDENDDSKEIRAFIRQLNEESSETITDTIFYSKLYTDANGNWLLEVTSALNSMAVYLLS